MYLPSSAYFLVIGIISYRLPLSTASSLECRCFPGDACWPNDDDWNVFNASVDGRLIRTVPIGHVCHDPTYDAEACEALRVAWTDTRVHIETSHSPMAREYTDNSCDPYTNRSLPCNLGNYVPYAVNVSNVEEISKTIRFAQEKNIRLVIRNTGHDYLGKSTGAGALALWTHNIKHMELTNWTDEYYTGKALKLGAGVMSKEAVAFTAQFGLTIVSGNCPSVGIAGGYIQGGGHGPLASKHGLAADHALEFEVIDATGRYLVVNRKQYSDLFWALRGGGGGTYAVVASVTVRTVPDEITSFATLQFGSAGLETDKYWDIVARFITGAPRYSDAGCWFVFSFANEGFSLDSLGCPRLDVEQTAELLRPYLQILDKIGIRYKKEVISFPRYSEFYKTDMLEAWEKNGAGTFIGAMWLIPPSVVANSSGAAAFVEASRKVADGGGAVFHIGMNLGEKFSGIQNAIRASYRNLFIETAITIPVDPNTNTSTISQAQWTVTNELLPLIQAISPDSGTYLNEADPYDPNWKNNFYGEYYDKLLGIKNRYDPENFFYARTAVGSDYWAERKGGRLCRVEGSKSHSRDEL